jgi:hypothetical protein
MRKIGRSKTVVGGFDHGLTRPDRGRIFQAPVTSWPGTARVDLNEFFAHRNWGDSIPSATYQPEHGLPDRPRYDEVRTVSLSDGTKLSFASAAHLGDDK